MEHEHAAVRKGEGQRALVEHDVEGLDVPVHDVPLVDVVQARHELDEEPPHLRLRHRLRAVLLRSPAQRVSQATEPGRGGRARRRRTLRKVERLPCSASSITMLSESPSMKES